MRTGCFSAAWLALREAADNAARDPRLMRRFAALLPPRPCILDLAAGTGGIARALAPLIAVEQRWRLVERDPALLAAQADTVLAWASRSGFAAKRGGDAAIVTAPGGAWHFFPVAHNLDGTWDALDTEAADGVAASAFFDLAGAAWIDRFARWIAAQRLPLLATLVVDGRRRYFPEDEDDAVVAAAFRRHQARDKGLGPALGPAAPEALAFVLAAQGYEVVDVPSDWRLGAGHGDLLRELVAGEAAAAREAGASADRWVRRRLEAIAAGRLTAIIGHRDLLALPPEICQNNRLQ